MEKINTQTVTGSFMLILRGIPHLVKVDLLLNSDNRNYKTRLRGFILGSLVIGWRRSD